MAWRGGFELLLGVDAADGDRFLQRFSYHPALEARAEPVALPAGAMTAAGGRIWVRASDELRGYDGRGEPPRITLPAGDWELLDSREDDGRVSVLLRAPDDRVALLRHVSDPSGTADDGTECTPEGPCALADRDDEPADRGYAAFLDDGRIFGVTANGFVAPLRPVPDGAAD